jgi:hypothetical protein
MASGGSTVPSSGLHPMTSCDPTPPSVDVHSQEESHNRLRRPRPRLSAPSRRLRYRGPHLPRLSTTCSSTMHRATSTPYGVATRLDSESEEGDDHSAQAGAPSDCLASTAAQLPLHCLPCRAAVTLSFECGRCHLCGPSTPPAPSLYSPWPHRALSYHFHPLSAPSSTRVGFHRHPSVSRSAPLLSPHTRIPAARSLH